MKYALILSVGLLAASYTPAYAENGLTVLAETRPTAAWVSRVSHELNRNLQYPNTPTSGFVSVRFECGPDGKPVNVAVLNHSRARFDAAAIRAVRQLRSLHPLPNNIGPGRQMQANLVFAANQDELIRQGRLLQQAEAKRLATSRPEHEILVLSSSSRSPG